MGEASEVGDQESAQEKDDIFSKISRPLFARRREAEEASHNKPQASAKRTRSTEEKAARGRREPPLKKSAAEAEESTRKQVEQLVSDPLRAAEPSRSSQEPPKSSSARGRMRENEEADASEPWNQYKGFQKAESRPWASQAAGGDWQKGKGFRSYQSGAQPYGWKSGGDYQGRSDEWRGAPRKGSKGGSGKGYPEWKRSHWW